MNKNKLLTIVLLFLFSLCVRAAGIDGTWMATFTTQIGEQNYTYEFKVAGTALTGTIKTANGESTLTDGKVEGKTLMFTENLKYQGQDLKITYKGEMTADDEISFTRNVAGIADEKLVAKRKK